MTEREIKVLDHGYVRAVEVYGSDERIIEAARMSTAKGFLGWGPVHTQACDRARAVAACVFHYGPDHDAAACTPCTCTPQAGDEKLLRYLYEHKHATPFEMAGLIIEVQAPIFVFREWHRHRTQSYNEMSARYVPLPNVNYVPTVERLLLSSKVNRQAGTVTGAEALNESGALDYIEILRESYDDAERLYQVALHRGVPKELARVHLPVGRYSRMRAAANLRNWLAFLTLRMDENAQWEIRQFANAVGELIAERFPRTWALFVEGRS